jgi:hypothetical protein
MNEFKSALLWCVFLSGLLACSSVARAQRAVDLERFEPALDAESFLGVQGTRTPGSDRMSLGLFADYGSTLLRAERTSGGQLELLQRRAGGVLSGEIGLGSRVALALAMPLVLAQSGQSASASEPALRSFALADPMLHVRYRFLGDTAETTQQRRDGPGVALQLSSSLPAGDADAYAGEDAVRTHAQLLGDMHLFGAGIGGSVGWRHRFERRELFGVSMHDELTFGAALKLPIPPIYTLAGLIEVRGATDFRSSATTAVEGELGLRYSFSSGLALTAAAGMGLTHGIGTPAFRAVAGLWYAPADPDSDHDGVPDTKDGCPFLPEDRDGFQDDDGCPDPDNDNDLVPDADDLCPNQAALENQDADEDGCTDPKK